MKIRKGFVSNSSSSSFIIGLSDISAKQLKQIYNHRLFVTNKNDWWDIVETEDYIKVSTFMDNFDMHTYLINIGINDEDIDGSYTIGELFV